MIGDRQPHAIIVWDLLWTSKAEIHFYLLCDRLCGQSFINAKKIANKSQEMEGVECLNKSCANSYMELTRTVG